MLTINSKIRSATAFVAIAGMLTTPLAMAQGDAPDTSDNANVVTAQNQNQNRSLAAGLQQATGLSGTQLGAIAAVAVIGGVIIASDSSSSSGTN